MSELSHYRGGGVGFGGAVEIFPCIPLDRPRHLLSEDLGTVQ